MYKIPDKTVDQIRTLWKRGYTKGMIKLLLGVSKKTIHNYTRGVEQMEAIANTYSDKRAFVEPDSRGGIFVYYQNQDKPFHFNANESSILDKIRAGRKYASD